MMSNVTTGPPACAKSDEGRVHETLLRLGAVLSSELELDRLAQKLTDEATGLCRAQLGAFFYEGLDEGGSSASHHAFSGVDRDLLATLPVLPVPVAAQAAGSALSSRADGADGATFDVLRSDDLTLDARFSVAGTATRGHDGGVGVARSYLAVAVRSRTGKLLGVLAFAHAESGVFTLADERLLAAVSSQAGVAIDNAKLFRALQRAERAADRERSKLHSLFKQSPAVIVILRGNDHVYDFVNDAALALLGADPTGKRLTDVLPAARPERIAILDHVFRSGERHVGTAIAHLRDWDANGRPYERFFDVTYEPHRDADGTVAGVMSFGFDVTEQVVARRKLEAAVEALEVANRTQDEFLATVSHELRTPLNAILGWVRMLRHGTLPNESRERALETIERNAVAQDQLVEDLLDVSRITTGKLLIDMRSVDVVSVVSQAIEAVRPAATAKGIALHQTVDPAAGPVVGDPPRLQQVLWNLVTNAVKFTPEGGAVRVDVRNGESSLDFVVSDDGQGMDLDFVPHVFERFRQADGTTERRYGGLGLGLAIVRHLVELHGGTVKATSEGRGRGATFTVSLPIASLRASTSTRPPPPSRQVQPREPPRRAEIDGIRVVVVDDERDARDLLAEMLADRKATVWTASNAHDALRLVSEHRPDVVVSDIGMPGEDGYALIRRLRALPSAAGGRTPAVALTAYARSEDRTRALGAGFDMHLPKPVERRELFAALSSLRTTPTD